MDLDPGGSPWGDIPSTTRPAQEPPASTGTEASKNSSRPDPSTSAGLAVTSTLPARGPRTPRKVEAQATQLEAVDDSLGPLGPLGDTSGPADCAPTDEPPAPPVKGRRAASRDGSDPSVVAPAPAHPETHDRPELDVDDDGESSSAKARIPPPVHPAPVSPPQLQRQTQPSMPVEQAAKPSFEITVGDPHKVGDLTSSHIVYQVRTKTTSKAYRQPEFSVSRRYRDFLWLYNQLHANNPGVVVPPPPEKQAVGRFESNFVESRRAALERMLNKSAAHPILQHDGDLKLFLESEAFSVDVKHKEKKEPPLGEGKGVLSSIGLSGSSGGKYVELDDWFHDRKVYLDALENQLKGLVKSIDTVVKQRKELADAAGDFSTSLHTLSTVELSPSLSGPLEGLSDLQVRIRDVYDRQAQHDVLTLGITVDEYIRLVGSIKLAFSMRQKAFHVWHLADGELQKRKTTQDKTLRQGKTQQDRLNQLSADVGDAERRVHHARLLYEDMGRLMRSELDRFEREKVEDFKSGVETFLESAVEAQKELIELWETYLMQLDEAEDGSSFYKAADPTPAPASGPALAPPAADDPPVRDPPPILASDGPPAATEE